ncbi:PH domain-containing protein [Cucumispora dikerogammari]|nr:PH domain-containing protein [Cucumispora dikerogammari]
MRKSIKNESESPKNVIENITTSFTHTKNDEQTVTKSDVSFDKSSVVISIEIGSKNSIINQKLSLDQPPVPLFINGQTCQCLIDYLKKHKLLLDFKPLDRIVFKIMTQTYVCACKKSLEKNNSLSIRNPCCSCKTPNFFELPEIVSCMNCTLNQSKFSATVCDNCEAKNKPLISSVEKAAKFQKTPKLTNKERKIVIYYPKGGSINSGVYYCPCMSGRNSNEIEKEVKSKTQNTKAEQKTIEEQVETFINKGHEEDETLKVSKTYKSSETNTSPLDPNEPSSETLEKVSETESSSGITTVLANESSEHVEENDSEKVSTCSTACECDVSDDTPENTVKEANISDHSIKGAEIKEHEADKTKSFQNNDNNIKNSSKHDDKDTGTGIHSNESQVTKKDGSESMVPPAVAAAVAAGGAGAGAAAAVVGSHDKKQNASNINKVVESEQETTPGTISSSDNKKTSGVYVNTDNTIGLSQQSNFSTTEEVNIDQLEFDINSNTEPPFPKTLEILSVKKGTYLHKLRAESLILAEGWIWKKRYFFSCLYSRRYFVLTKDAELIYFRDPYCITGEHSDSIAQQNGPSNSYETTLEYPNTIPFNYNRLFDPSLNGAPGEVQMRTKNIRAVNNFLCISNPKFLSLTDSMEIYRVTNLDEAHPYKLVLKHTYYNDQLLFDTQRERDLWAARVTYIKKKYSETRKRYIQSSAPASNRQ